MIDESSTQRTHFGFKTVDTEQKQGMVRDVFDRVASRYDIMNDLMSAGLHRVWKEEFVRGLRLPPHAKLLDVAGGTGDIAFRSLRHYPHTDVTLCDINAAMLNEGRKRAIDRNLLTPRWVCGNAEALPFTDNSFDAYTIAFGIRNVTHIDKALAEARRVLKPGGRFHCLEFAPIDSIPLKALYDAYSFNLIPWIGEKVTGDGAPYQYLVESIRRFPKQADFAAMIERAGFSRVSYRSLNLGVVAIHQGWRL